MLARISSALLVQTKDIAKRVARLVSVIETGGDAASLVAKLRELEARQRAIVGEAAALLPVPRLAPAVIENRLAEWRRLLRSSTTQARTVLQRILRGRLVFTPHVNPVSGEVDGYDFVGPTRFDKLFTGIAVRATEGACADALSGCEDIGPEDTFDGDYGRLLERAYEKKRERVGVPNGIRTRVLALKGPRPGPLDDGDVRRVLIGLAPEHLIITGSFRHGNASADDNALSLLPQPPHALRATSDEPRRAPEHESKPRAPSTEPRSAIDSLHDNHRVRRHRGGEELHRSFARATPRLVLPRCG